MRNFAPLLLIPTLFAQDGRAPLRGAMHPLARQENDLGRVPAATQLSTVTLLFAKTARQQSDLDSLLAAQQNPRSPQYHKWLTPAEYNSRFGIAPSDARRVSEWLNSAGFHVDRFARSGLWVAFSGTAGDIERAFQTELHRYSSADGPRIAPAREPSVPSELRDIAATVIGLDTFPMHPAHPPHPDSQPNGTHRLAPGDLAAIYNALPLYAQGIDGTGQKIAIIGQSDVNVDDVRSFRSLYSLPPSDPVVQLYGPQPPADREWEVEESADLEWAGAMARGATLILAEAQTSLSALQFAVDDNLAPVMSLSAGDCEAIFSDNRPLLGRAIAQQANAQGITWLNASGDSGAGACTGHSTAVGATDGLAVSFPASIPEVTAVGGTQFAAFGSTYWSAINRADNSSALGYVPEAVWNTTAQEGIPSGSGGGASKLYPKPAWQSGPGVPDDGVRDVPDISLPADPIGAPYDVFYSAHSIALGGTSLGTPSFAGVLALVNQYVTGKGLQPAPGLGNINPALYRLAQTVPTAFHDIVAGDNIVPCVVGTAECYSGSLGYSAAPGYDLATGLGSIDITRFVTSWGQAVAPSGLTLTASPSSIPMSGSTVLTAGVSVTGAAPSGTISFVSAGAILGSAPVATGSAQITVSGGVLAVGPNAVEAVYSGDANWSGSSAATSVYVVLPPANSAVAISVTPNPAYWTAPDSSGNTYTFTLLLTEMGGVASTISNVTVDGAAMSPATVFGGASLPANGSLSGTIHLNRPSGAATVNVAVSGKDAGGSSWTQQIPIQLYGPVYLTTVSNLSNAASGMAFVAPGEVVSVYGKQLAAFTATAIRLPLPLSLASATATVNGVPAPLYFASPAQVNLQIPYETSPGTAVLDIANGPQHFTYAFYVKSSAPGIFSNRNVDIVPSSVAARGSIVTMFITGEGLVNPPLPSGSAPDATTPVDLLPVPVLPVSVTVNGVAANVVFAGIPPGLAGVTQVNFVVPLAVPFGSLPVVVTVGGVASFPAYLTVPQQ